MKLPIKDVERKILSGLTCTYEDACELSRLDDIEQLLESANNIRSAFCGDSFELCAIANVKCGECSENCKFCAQSAHYNTGIEIYPFQDQETVLNKAKENEKKGVHRFSIVTSGRTLSEDDFDKAVEIVTLIRRETTIKLCASLGIISYDRVVALKDAGITRYHHNLESCRDFFPNICTTHTYEERINTINNASKAGLDICSGGIIGLGESMIDRINLAFELKALKVPSVPINILTPIRGTPLESITPISPLESIKTMAIFRFILPSTSLRYAGGRIQLGEYQEKGLCGGINAALTGDYLSTLGSNVAYDVAMVARAGFIL